MHNHFDKYLNVRQIILDAKPSHVVECGALFGENTRQLVELKKEIPFKLTVITDNDVSIDGVDNLIRGISYEEIQKMPDESIDICIIDTDHNYWTLAVELSSLHAKLKKGGLIILHDVSAFYFDTGLAGMYFNGKDYPKQRIEEIGKQRGGIGNALMDFLSVNRTSYQLITFTSESCGAAVVKKVMRDSFLIATPTQEKIDQIKAGTERVTANA